MNTHTPQWLTMADYANATGVSLSKVKRMKLAGNLPCVQDGRTVRIPATALDFDWLQNWQANHKRTA